MSWHCRRLGGLLFSATAMASSGELTATADGLSKHEWSIS